VTPDPGLNEAIYRGSRLSIAAATAPPLPSLPVLKTSRRNLWIWVILFAVTLLAYLPALRAGFVWDDDGFVTKPELRSLGGLWRIWTDLSSTEQFYPLLHGFFWFQYRVFGDTPFGYHLVNVLLHAACAGMLVLVVRRLFDGRAATPLAAGPTADHGGERSPRPTSDGTADNIALLSGLLFALHPVYVESVAWIAEQKNTFSLLWYLLAAWVYLGRPNTVGGVPSPRDRTPVGGTRPTAIPWYRSPRYWLATLFFLLSILAKSLTATLPCALLVMTWWRRGRITWSDCLPMLPWFAAGAAFGILTGWVEYHYMGAQGAHFDLNLLERGLLAGRILWFYPTKLLWPDLIFIYERWHVDATVWWQWLYPLAAILFVAWLWRLSQRTRGPLAASLFYGGSLFPTGGFFNVYAFKFSYVADHWHYLPSLGYLVLAAAGIVMWGKRHAAIVRPAILALLVLLGGLTWRQTLGYRDMETFYRTILAKNRDCALAHNNLGLLLREDGRLEEAATHFREMLRIDPKDADATGKLAVTYTRLGRPDEAVRQYESALRLKPANASIENDLAAALVSAGRREEAVPHFERALQMQPDFADASYNYGNLLYNLGRPAVAATRYVAALKAKPDHSGAEHNLGAAYLALGRNDDAAAHFTAALRLRPDYFEAHYNLALVLTAQGKINDAILSLQTAVRLRPNHVAARAALVNALTRVGRTQEAASVQIGRAP
jgi:tetratricopeptide (TPR) repeat protein